MMLINFISFYEPASFKLIMYLQIKNTYRHFFKSLISSVMFLYVCIRLSWLT